MTTRSRLTAASTTASRLHLWVGVVVFVVFLATGQHMRYLHEPPVAELEPGLRMLTRSRHIYLLFAGLLNLLAATPGPTGRPGWLRMIGSCLLILAPVLLLAAFFVETTALHAPTALSITGVQAALAGTVCYLLARWIGRER